jgi:hypothetical protein
MKLLLLAFGFLMPKLVMWLAPAPTNRTKPSGFKLEDGYRTLMTLSLDPAVQIWEKTVKPPGVDGGDPIPQTTMHNDHWRTFAPKALKTLTEVTGKAGYDPQVYLFLFASVNIPCTITITFPQHGQLAFYGFLQKVEIDEHAEGTMPEMTYTIGITNVDFANNFVEEGPVYVPSPGTP